MKTIKTIQQTIPNNDIDTNNKKIRIWYLKKTQQNTEMQKIA